MLHPDQFQVNEAWIAFKLNDAPIQTGQGPFDGIGLMDAASCFILASAFFPADDPEPSELELRHLLETGWAHKKEFPATLFVPTGQVHATLSAEAKRQGISVVPVHESQLLLFIGEARRSFREHFEGGGVGDA